MSDQPQTTTIRALPAPTDTDDRLPAVLTRLVWLLWFASAGILVVYAITGTPPSGSGILRIDGLTVVMWLTVTFFSGIVHSYSRRYMAGTRQRNRFFGRVFAFTLTVMLLVAADHFLLFVGAWLGMGVIMARLIGHLERWPQARIAGRLARRYFFASSALLAIACLMLWSQTGITTVSAVPSAVMTLSTPMLLGISGALVLAAMAQSALIPFHTWLLASMTAPTPASALMHAGFVNAGGILLARFASIVTVVPGVMLAIVLIGATSALVGKLLKSVQVDAKLRLGCSTTGQMGFMLMQAGLGYFAAAITHLILHGCYKAYLFLSVGEEIAHTSPTESTHPTGGLSAGGLVVTAVTAIAGGLLFAVLTGKGARLDSGLLLTGLIVVTTLHATQSALRARMLPARYRYAALPLVFLPAIAIYAGVYTAVGQLMADLPVLTAPTTLTAVHGVVALAFFGVYLAIETGVYRHSTRLYVALVNATRPPAQTLLTAPEEYHES